jgi:hypothetical protein
MDVRPQFSPTRMLVVRARELLSPGDTSDVRRLEFTGGDGWLIGLNFGFRLTPEFYAGFYVANMVAVKILINADALTENGRGVDFVLCEDFRGEQKSWFPLCRRMRSHDNIYVTWRHIGDPNLAFPVEIKPCVTFRYLLDADLAGVDREILANMAGGA